MRCNMQEMQSIVIDMLQATIDVCEKNNITYYCQAGTVLGAIRHKGFIPWDHDADLVIPENEIDRFIECAARDLPSKYYVDYYTLNPKAARQFPRIALTGYSSNVLHLDIFRLIGLPDSEEEQIRLMENAQACTQKIKMRRTRYRYFIKRLDFKGLAERIALSRTDIISLVDDFSALCKRYPYATANYVMNPSGRYGRKNIFRKEIYGAGLTVPFGSVLVRIPSEFDFYLRQYYQDYMQIPDAVVIQREMQTIFEVK